MKISNLTVTILFLLTIFYFSSCRKPDLVQIPETSIKTQIGDDRFFNVPLTASPEAKAIAEAIKKQDGKFHFLSSVITKAGYPVWDKAKIINLTNKTITGRSSSDSSGGELVYIPFALDSQRQTNAVLAVRLNNPDTTYRMLYASRYKTFGYDTTDHTKWNARDVFHLFSTFDYTVFGHTKFLIKDDSLFKRPNDSVYVVLTLKNYRGQPVTGRTSFAVIEECTTYEVCHYPLDDNGGGYVRSSATNSHCDYFDICTYIDDGGTGGGGTGSGSTGTGDGTGSTGGGGWWSGDGGTNPCPGTIVRTSVIAPINDCGPGWAPVLVNNIAFNYIVNIVNLSSAQRLWLAANSFEASQIFQALQESLNQDPIAENVFLTAPPPEALAAAQITIEAAMNGRIYGPYDNNHYNLIKLYIPNSQNYPGIDPVWFSQFLVRCALIKIEHPEYNGIRVYFEAINEMVHLGLDVIGLFPVAGEVADLLNGAIYTLQGDGVNATLSFASAIPVAGWFSAGIKFATRGVNLASGAKTTLKWIKRTDNFIDFGDRGQLRTVLGLAKGDARVAHHVIPWDFWDNPVVQTAAKHNDAFHLNELLNGIPLSTAVHSGNHLSYITKIRNRLTTAVNLNPNLTPENAKVILTNLINDIKTAIQNNPTTHIDNLPF